MLLAGTRGGTSLRALALALHLAASVQFLRLPSQLHLQRLDLLVLGGELFGELLGEDVGGDALDAARAFAGLGDGLDVGRVGLLRCLGVGGVVGGIGVLRFGVRVPALLLGWDGRASLGVPVPRLVRVLPGVLVLDRREGLGDDGGDRGGATEHLRRAEPGEHRGRGVATGARDGGDRDDAGDDGDRAEAAEGPRQRAGALGGDVRLEEALLLGREQRARLVARGRGGRRGGDDAAGKHLAC